MPLMVMYAPCSSGCCGAHLVDALVLGAAFLHGALAREEEPVAVDLHNVKTRRRARGMGVHARCGHSGHAWIEQSTLDGGVCKCTC